MKSPKTRIYQMPNGKWYWSDTDQEGFTYKSIRGGFGGDKHGFDSRMEAIDGLATHIGFIHTKYDPASLTEPIDIAEHLRKRQIEHEAIRRALLSKVEK